MVTFRREIGWVETQLLCDQDWKGFIIDLDRSQMAIRCHCITPLCVVSMSQVADFNLGVNYHFVVYLTFNYHTPLPGCVVLPLS